MASVTLDGIQKHFGDNHVVRDLDLAIADGEFAVLVGPSGCGKSTTLRMIAGLEEITGGDLHIGDRRCNDLSPRDRDIAMVFQSYALYPHMTVRENMAFGLMIRKLPRAEIDARVNEAAALLDISDLLDRRPKAMSGGQRQRVAMGRAVVREPAVFLFDEPLSNLDAKLRVQMRLEVARLHKRLGVTIVYVTHDQVEAMTLADRIAIMRLGILQQFATPSEVYATPANTFVATFIGSPAMNLFPVRVDSSAGDVVLQGAGLRLVVDTAWTDFIEANGGHESEWTVGIRPQHFSQCSQQDANLQLDVDVVEPLGAETFVYGTAHDAGEPALRDEATNERGQSPIVIRLNADARVTVGGRLPCRASLADLQLFNLDGERVAAASGHSRAADSERL